MYQPLCATAQPFAARGWVNPLLPTRTTGSSRCAAAFNLRILGLVKVGQGIVRRKRKNQVSCIGRLLFPPLHGRHRV